MKELKELEDRFSGESAHYVHNELQYETGLRFVASDDVKSLFLQDNWLCQCARLSVRDRSEAAFSDSTRESDGAENKEPGVAFSNLSPVMTVPTPLQLHTLLQETFGFPGFRPGQKEIVERLLSGESLLAMMPTGSGKSLCYQLPAVIVPGCTLVISPLIALMKDQLDGLPPILAKQSTVINSSVDGGEVDRRLRAIASKKIRLVFAAPERLRQLNFLYALSRAGVSLMVIDEAHCIDEWGHDFRPDYATLFAAVAALGRPPILALTATATPAAGDAIERALGVSLKRMSFGVCRPNLRLEVTPVADQDAKNEAIVQACQRETGRGIIYVSTRHDAEKLALLLRRKGIETGYYHAGLEPDERVEAHSRFQEGSLRLMVATVAFGLGIDIPDVRFVLHYDAPICLQSYAQEAGRAGRDGLPARCTLLLVPDDEERLRHRVGQHSLKMETFREVYEATGRLLEERVGIVAMDDLRRKTGLEATDVRIALASLEKVGLLRRHYDTPVSMSLRRGPNSEIPDSPPQIARLIERFCPADGSWNDAPATELAETLGLAFDALESFLLACQQEEWVRYRGGRREFTLERPRAPEGAKAALDAHIAQFEEAQQMRITSMLDYISSRRCRHEQIAKYFGQTAPATCAACDNCRPMTRSSVQASVRPQLRLEAVSSEEVVPNPSPAPLELSPLELSITVLRAVASLPFPLGVQSLVQLLRGAVDSPLPPNRSRYHGVLKSVARDDARAIILQLIEADDLIVRQEGERKLLGLTPSGARRCRTDEESAPLST